MQTITTHFIAATHNQGPQIRARASNGKGEVVIPYKHTYVEDAHAEAALTLARRLGWVGTLIEGDTQDGKVYVFSTGDRHKI